MFVCSASLEKQSSKEIYIILKHEFRDGLEKKLSASIKVICADAPFHRIHTCPVMLAKFAVLLSTTSRIQKCVHLEDSLSCFYE